jgi:hypothetical protein
MADFSSSFVNPSYATPEQLATQRAYAAELTKRSGETVQRPAGALANMITALTAGLERNRANEMQSQAAGQNSGDVSALIAQLQKGQPIDPATAGRVYANPMAAPEHRALIGALVTPQKTEDVYGRPGYQSPSSGVQPAPINSSPGLPFTPGYRAAEAAGSVATTTPFPAPLPAPGMSPAGPRVPPTPPGVTRLDPQATEAWRQRTPLPAPPPPGGVPAPVATSPPAAAPASGISPRLKQMAADSQQIEAEGARVKAGAGGEGEIILKDVTRAAAAPETLKGLGIMRNTIESVGDKMTFGPTAKFSNEARRVISNYAPGLVDEKALSGADAIEKLNLGLAGNLSQQLGLNPSDIFRSVASVPGNEKSKAGTLALINMMEQAARNDQYVGTTLYQQNRGNLAAYQEARQAYYNSHPVINPITGNPVQIDAQKAAETPPAATGFKVLRVH